jgi:uncharacterized protein
MKILIHLTQGPENPTVASLAFLVAKTAAEKGHTINLFLAGEAVQLARTPVLENLEGLGTGKLNDHFKAVVSSGGKIYLSGMSCKARGVSPDDLAGKPMEFAMPDVLVQLAVESEKMFVY